MKSVLEKRGLSPVVATVLLILLVVIIAMIIFLWFRSITQESVTKFNSNVQVICGELDFDVSYNDGTLAFVNNAQAPIYDFMILSTDSDSGSSDAVSLRDTTSFSGLASGAVAEVEYESSSELKIVPVLLGETESGETQTYECDEGTGVTVTTG